MPAGKHGPSILLHERAGCMDKRPGSLRITTFLLSPWNIFVPEMLIWISHSTSIYQALTVLRTGGGKIQGITHTLKEAVTGKVHEVHNLHLLPPRPHQKWGALLLNDSDKAKSVCLPCKVSFNTVQMPRLASPSATLPKHCSS